MSTLSIEQMYQNMIEAEGTSDLFSELDQYIMAKTDSFDSSRYNPDDTEEFLTSKEVVKNKELMEEQLGIHVQPDHEVEETAHFKIYNKQRKHVYTETEMKKIRESCVSTIVHDYSEKDFFHMTDEERAENDMLSEIGVKLGSLKRTYRKVDQYVEAMRVVVQAWELLEKAGNFAMSPDDFFKLVSEGIVYSNRIIMPKLKRFDQYNLDLIVKYISNPNLDPKDLVPVKEEPQEFDLFDDFYVDIEGLMENNIMVEVYYTEFIEQKKDEYKKKHNIPLDQDIPDDDSIPKDERFNESDYREDAITYIQDHVIMDEMERLLPPEDIQTILNSDETPPEMKIEMVKRRWIKGYDKRTFSTKHKYHGKKKERDIIIGMHDLLNQIQNNPKNHDDDVTKSYMITHSMFDASKPEKDFWDDLYYTGSWKDDNAYYLYELALQEKFMNSHPPKESYITYREQAVNRFFNILERQGVNTVELRRKMNCTDQDNKIKESNRSKKENRKIEEAVFKRVIALNESSKFKKLTAKAEKALNDFNNN